MKPALRAAEASGMIPDGATLLIGGLMAVATPERPIDALVARPERLSKRGSPWQARAQEDAAWRSGPD